MVKISPGENLYSANMHKIFTEASISVFLLRCCVRMFVELVDVIHTILYGAIESSLWSVSFGSSLKAAW